MSARAAGLPDWQDRERTRDEWLNDFYWHYKSYRIPGDGDRGAAWRWTGRSVHMLITSWTHGQTEFIGVQDLTALARALERGERFRDAAAIRMGDAATQAWAQFLDWGQIAGEVGLSEDELEHAVGRWHQHMHDGGEDFEPADLAKVRKKLAGDPLTNPLIALFEVKQIYRLYEAALEMLTDVAADLVVELRTVISNDEYMGELAEIDPSLPSAWVDAVYPTRGGPGDPRRVPPKQQP